MNIFSYKSELNENGTMNLVKENEYKIDGRHEYTSPEMIANFAGDSIGLKKAAEEYVYIICFDAANHIIGLFQASQGAANASMIPTREICKKALLLNSINIAIIHNHPSGNTQPSEPDIISTEKLKRALDIIDLKLIDHIIVGGNTDNYYSFKENNLM